MAKSKTKNIVRFSIKYPHIVSDAFTKARLPAKPYDRKPSPPSGSGAATEAASGSRITATSSPSLKDALSADTPDSGDTFPKDFRGCLLEYCQSLNPHLQPRAGEMRDWDIQVLATVKASEVEAKDFAAWSESKLEDLYWNYDAAGKLRRRAAILKSTTELLDGPPAAVGVCAFDPF